MSDTLHFAMKMIEAMSEKDPAKAAQAAIALHQTQQLRTDLLTYAVPAIAKAYADSQTLQAAQLANEARRLEQAEQRLEIERTAAEAAAEKTRAMAKVYSGFEYRLDTVIETEIQRRVAGMTPPRSNGAYHAEDADHLDD